MITSVVYKNGDIGMIGTSSLDELIASEKRRENIKALKDGLD